MEFAIKKFKPDENASLRTHIVGISQSACRETALCSELRHENIVGLEEVIVDPIDKSIYLVFDYAEHDLLQMLHYHSSTFRTPVAAFTLKSIMWQLLQGVDYLHSNWVLHRDLKPANILVTSSGVIKIADLGLGRLYARPLQPLSQTDRVVVTIWYRGTLYTRSLLIEAPELLLGSKHYTSAIDIWAIGCIFAELLILKPLFKADEIKADAKKGPVFQKLQMEQIISLLGVPTATHWPLIAETPDYPHLAQFRNHQNTLRQYIAQNAMTPVTESELDLLCQMLDYNPDKRITAAQALDHPFFKEAPLPALSSFQTPAGDILTYPRRTITYEDNDIIKNPPPVTRKRKNSNN